MKLSDVTLKKYTSLTTNAKSEILDLLEKDLVRSRSWCVQACKGHYSNLKENTVLIISKMVDDVFFRENGVQNI